MNGVASKSLVSSNRKRYLACLLVFRYRSLFGDRRSDGCCCVLLIAHIDKQKFMISIKNIFTLLLCVMYDCSLI